MEERHITGWVYFSVLSSFPFAPCNTSTAQTPLAHALLSWLMLLISTPNCLFCFIPALSQYLNQFVRNGDSYRHPKQTSYHHTKSRFIFGKEFVLEGFHRLSAPTSALVNIRLKCDQIFGSFAENPPTSKKIYVHNRKASTSPG